MTNEEIAVIISKYFTSADIFESAIRQMASQAQIGALQLQLAKEQQVQSALQAESNAKMNNLQEQINQLNQAAVESI